MRARSVTALLPVFQLERILEADIDSGFIGIR